MQLIIEKLKCSRTRQSTKDNYLGIWQQFNKFMRRLDIIPEKWEDQAILFCAHLVEQGLQSSSIKSYLSAIKGVLRDDNYDWNEDKLLILMMTRACCITNDRLCVRLPIGRSLLEVVLFELGRIFKDQPYLLITY